MVLLLVQSAWQQPAVYGNLPSAAYLVYTKRGHWSFVSKRPRGGKASKRRRGHADDVYSNLRGDYDGPSAFSEAGC